MDYKQMDFIRTILEMNNRCIICQDKITEMNIGGVLLKEQAVLCVKCKDIPRDNIL